MPRGENAEYPLEYLPTALLCSSDPSLQQTLSAQEACRHLCRACPPLPCQLYCRVHQHTIADHCCPSPSRTVLAPPFPQMILECLWLCPEPESSQYHIHPRTQNANPRRCL